MQYDLYLPIAGVSVNAWLLVGLGGFVGFASGVFGVGGGFLITPLLFVIGIPPAVAVATSTNQVAASSFSGVMAHMRRRAVDVQMGLVLLAGGLTGSGLGILIFNTLKSLGHIDLIIKISYVVLLGTVGSLMFVESVRAMRKTRDGGSAPRRSRQSLMQTLPFKVRFRVSGLYISVIPPLFTGMSIGLLSVLGVGGGFVLVPALIYVLRVPTKVVVGTSLFQVGAVSAFTMMLQAITNHTVDFVLALPLLLGGVVGAQLGSIVGQRLKAEQLRILLAVLVLAVCFKVLLDLVVRPSELYTLAMVPHG